MRFFSYAQLLNGLCIAEKRAAYEVLTERHLQALWLEQKYFDQLTTDQGEPITVLSPGIWNAEAGPDFLKAHLKIGSREYRGDIELHFVDDSWIKHGHHTNADYENTILHVSLSKLPHAQPLYTKSGREVAKTYLEEKLTVTSDRIIKLIDLDLYPYQEFAHSGRCASHIFNALTEEESLSLFQSAAEWRLRKKKQRLEVYFESSSDQLLAGIAMALGYKNNAQMFLELFVWLNSLKHLPYDQLFSLAMLSSGFFSSYYQDKWKDSSCYNNLKSYAESILEPVPQFNLKLSQIRPYNHPLRRFAYLCQLLKDPHAPSLYNTMIDLWSHSWRSPDDKKKWKHLWENYCALIPTYTHSYWNFHYTFETESSQEFLTLIGDSLKNEILVNTWLPLLYAHVEKQGCSEELAGFRLFYNSLKGEESRKKRYLTQRFFATTPKGKMLEKAAIEQGSYQVHHDFCAQYEASCVGCPFVDLVKQQITV